MAGKEKLLAKARQSPNNLRYSELCKLAEAYGWVFDRPGKGSHEIYFNPDFPDIDGATMNFQNKNGQAKRYQVEQLVNAIDRLGEK